MTIEEKLDDLSKEWLVRLETTGSGKWFIGIARRGDGRRELTYQGTLADVVDRCHAGSPDDKVAG